MDRSEAKRLSGRELDALVAEKVMGWKLHASGRMKGFWEDRQKIFHIELWKFSTDIAAAWSAIEHLLALATAAMDQPYFEIRTCGSYYTARWTTEEREGPDVVEDADTAPLAICRAALKVVEVPRG